MGIIYQLDKRSGITYAYLNEAKWNKEKKRSESKRKLLGRVINLETMEYVPTDGRCKKLSPYLTEEEKRDVTTREAAKAAKSGPATARMTKAQCLEEIERLRKENAELRERLAQYEGGAANE